MERLIWMRDWTIWNDRIQESGLRCLHLLVDNITPTANDADARAYVLDADEWREAIALLTAPILFGWHAPLVDISYHGTMTVSFGPSGVERNRLDGWCGKEAQGSR